jgi:hypothetical protein
MNPDQVMELYKFLGVIFSATIGATTFLIVTVIKLFKYLEKKTVETSVGATAISNLMQEYKVIEEDLENFKKTVKVDNVQITNEVSKLARHVQEFIFNAMQLFGMQNKN